MHGGPEVVVAMIVCFALTAGAAMRALSARIHLPYTVSMLLVGIATGGVLQALERTGQLSHSLEKLALSAPVSPELIVFIFLPVLIFESSFATNVPAFQRNLGPVLLLAGPALLLSTVITAAMMLGLTQASWAWGWIPALIFGALISATDPVAVVALLREAGAPRRLGVLIEGESLFNDGTAIVLFGVLLELLVGAAHFEPGQALLRFLGVSLGGLAVGLLLAVATTTWLSRTFNAPLIEITLTLALAYGAMFVAEYVFHVSGVIAVVAAGLWMSGRGRLHISPEVAHFLHRFWEMLSYLANTLIFFLVGWVVATQIGRAGNLDFGLIGAAYLGIVVLRFGLVFLFRPLMGRVSSPISAAEATIISWGGLRGAVSLALALVVAYHHEVDSLLGQQLLLTTAGVALLTICINGVSMSWLLARLGFDRLPPGDRLAGHAAEASALSLVEHRIERLSDSRDLRTVDWSRVESDLEHRAASLRGRVEEARRELETAAADDRLRGYWRQALNMERQAIWTAFGEGTLGTEATRILDAEIDQQLHRLSAGAVAPSEERGSGPPPWRILLGRWLRRLGPAFGREQFELLALRYDLYRGEQLAAEFVLHDLAQRGGLEADLRRELQQGYRRHLHGSKQRLEDLRVNLPEITLAIETRLARRIQLNLERESYRELAQVGALESSRASEAMAEVEQKMKALRFGKRAMALPETGDLCRHTPLFEGLDEQGIELVARLTRECVFAPDEILFRQGDEGRSLFIIARGAVAVVREGGPGATGDRLLDILGGGDILGEMALLTGERRNATARAVTTVTLGEISRSDLRSLFDRQPRLERAVWQSFAERIFDNHVRGLPGYEQLSRSDRIDWLRRGEAAELTPGQLVPTGAGLLVFLCLGELEVEGRRQAAPVLLPIRAGEPIRALTQSRITCLPLLFAEDSSGPDADRMDVG